VGGPVLDNAHNRLPFIEGLDGIYKGANAQLPQMINRKDNNFLLI
jgi:hypothetical protein